MTVKYNLAKLVSVEPELQLAHARVHVADHDRAYCLKMNFNAKTTARRALFMLLERVKESHATYSRYLSQLHAECFLLKVAGRGEYLKRFAENHKIIDLSYVRDCIRKQRSHCMQMVLLYDDSMRDLNDADMRRELKHSYDAHYSCKPSQAQEELLQYERRGFNVITDTLCETMHRQDVSLNKCMDRLTDDVEAESLWLQQKV